MLRLYEQQLPEDIRTAVEFVIIDDGSPIKYDIGTFDLNITWLRINEDIPWNQAGALNLGVTYAKSDKNFITDLDQELPESSFRYLINCRNPGRNFYKIYQESRENGVKKRGKVFNFGDRYYGHPNTFFMSRARFMRFFGYDEDFAGNYGSEDFRFVKYQNNKGRANIICRRASAVLNGKWTGKKVTIRYSATFPPIRRLISVRSKSTACSVMSMGRALFSSTLPGKLNTVTT